MSKLTEQQLNEISKTVHDKMIADSTNQMAQAIVELSLNTIVEFIKEYQKQIED